MNPDVMFIYSDRRKGIGGLPVGTSGQVLSLLSGGIDSPVASFLLARRGCIVDWFHVSATHLQARDFSESVVGRIASRLSRHTMCSRLFTVPYTHFDLELGGLDTGYEPVLFRRFLFRVAEELGRKIGSAALVTGDSLGQVASQTLENLIASAKSTDMPLLRPLLGLGKQEIMDLAKQIGTYEISIEPYKDCCALYSRNVRTKTLDAVLTDMEERIFGDYRSVITRTLDDVMWAEYECGKLVEIHQGIGELSIDVPLLQED
jgi:thiamine biosynthesis protein ThiI